MVYDRDSKTYVDEIISDDEELDEESDDEDENSDEDEEEDRLCKPKSSICISHRLCVSQ